MKKQTVYVPVNAETLVAYKKETLLIDYLKGSCHTYEENRENVYVPADIFQIKDVGLVAIATLIHKEGYFHTEEELLELKKKWCEDAFEAGCFYEYARMEEHLRGTKNIFQNKETYLNNIKL